MEGNKWIRKMVAKKIFIDGIIIFHSIEINGNYNICHELFANIDLISAAV